MSPTWKWRGGGRDSADGRADAGASGRPLGARLLLSQAVVLVASVVTAGLVALVVGPPVFHEHLVRAGANLTAPELQHVEEAFLDANLIALGIALVIALGCALLVTWYLTGRIQRPLIALTGAAREMGRGHYGARAEIAGAGPEIDSVARAFNSMAARLEATEETRRRLLSDLAHEMRTPVATISAYLDGLDDEVVPWGPASAGVIRSQTQRLARLCDDLSEVSRTEEGQVRLDRDVHAVRDILEAAAHAAASAYEAKGVTLEVDVGEARAVLVDVDPERIAQVLANLLSNALRHTPSGGRVMITAQQEVGGVRLVVADTGEGMAPQQLEHVFERFYRGDSARDHDSRGSGIGLTIAKALVDAHGGSLNASSPGSGQGSTFTISLPRATRPDRPLPATPDVGPTDASVPTAGRHGDSPAAP